MIARAGGISPLVRLLSSPSAVTAQNAAAALEALARDHPENQIALAKAGAIVPLVSLLGSWSVETQEHAVGAPPADACRATLFKCSSHIPKPSHARAHGRSARCSTSPRITAIQRRLWSAGWWQCSISATLLHK